MTETTVLIKTLGRHTLRNAIASAKREKFKVIVVSDGCRTSSMGANKFVKLGRKWGYYGGMATNVGAAMAETEFITLLDDDDEFIPGAGDIIRSKFQEKPHVDIWIGGVRFNEDVSMVNPAGEVLYKTRDFAIHPHKGLVEGNVAMPTYRTKIFEVAPFTNTVPADQGNLTDLHHILNCHSGGFKVDWFESVLYLVRPILGGHNGEGK